MGCALLVGLAACVGNLDDGNGPSDPIDDDPAGTQDVELSSAALRRLSIHELENTYRSVVGFVPQAIERIPPDSLTHSFDRVVNAQTMSPAHLEAFVAIADEAATTLMTEQSLATVVAGCPAAQIPSLAVSKLVSIAGNALSLGPEWAVGNAGNPQWGSTTYAPDPTAAYTHAFPTPGAYAISATVDVNGTVDVMELSVNGEAAAAATTVTGLSTVGATVTIDAVGSYIIGLSLDTEPDDNGLAVVFRSLTIEGPLQSTAEPEAPQVRACAMAVIDELAPRAERRPLDASTRDRLTSLYDGAVASHGSAQALHAQHEQHLLLGLLQLLQVRRQLVGHLQLVARLGQLRLELLDGLPLVVLGGEAGHEHAQEAHEPQGEHEQHHDHAARDAVLVRRTLVRRHEDDPGMRGDAHGPSGDVRRPDSGRGCLFRDRSVTAPRPGRRSGPDGRIRRPGPPAPAGTRA